MDDKEYLVGSVPKNKREEVRVSLSKFKGFDLVGIRVWFKDSEGALKPSRDGFALRTELLPSLITLLDKAREEAKRRGLLGGSSGDSSGKEPEDIENLLKVLSPNDREEKG